jgi:hypothetical protein
VFLRVWFHSISVDSVHLINLYPALSLSHLTDVSSPSTIVFTTAQVDTPVEQIRSSSSRRLSSFGTRMMKLNLRSEHPLFPDQNPF